MGVRADSFPLLDQLPTLECAMIHFTRNRDEKSGPPFVNCLGTLKMHRGILLLVFMAIVSRINLYMQYEDRKLEIA